MNNYVPYHVHTMYSLLDSTTSYKQYVDRAVECGMKAICFTEHGNNFGWFRKKRYCDEHGIKFLYGIECYLTETLDEKIRDNYHTVLIAKNMDGFTELNRLIALSYRPEQRYYKPRLSFEQFLVISDNIIKISACLASPLWSFRKHIDKAEQQGEDVSSRRELYLRMAKHYDYYEVQYHGGEQAEYNKLLYEIAQELDKPLIAGTDTHSIDSYSAECRILLKFGKTEGDWGDSENEFDLTFKTYDEVVAAFRRQDALPENVWLEAIENTNRMADSVEPLVIDTKVKYPILYPGQDEEKIMQDRIRAMYRDKVARGIIDGNNPQYWENVRTEMAVFQKINMVGFMLFMSELMCWAREHNIYTSPCRGSVGGSTIAYITDIIDLDPVKRHTVFSRFANEYREEVGDIDTDWYEDDRPKVYEHMFDRFGMDKCAYILAMGTLADAAAIDVIGKAFRVMSEQKGEESEYTLAKIAEIKEEWAKDRDKTREKYPDIFKYYDGLVGCIVSQSQHPAGIVVAPLNLIDGYSVFYNKEDMQILPLDMDEVHECGLVKYDILGLKNVGIIAKTCEYAGLPLPHEYSIDWEDQDVFDDMVSNPVGIFQFESEYAFNTLRDYHRNIKRKGLKFTVDDMTVCNACIRPSGASYRDDLIALRNHKNPSPMIDELLANTHGFLVYQEQTIAFLQEICGLSGGEADNVRRAIGRKQADRLEAALPGILDGYCNKSDQPRDVAEREAKEFIQIIEDSASYQFGYNHATGYSMVGYLCAYYRHYYPLEFCTAFLNCSKSEDDIRNGTDLIKHYGFKIMPARFRRSRSGFFFDKQKGEIYKSIDSIKYMSPELADELYALRDEWYGTFMDLLKDLREKTSIDSRQLDILINLDFFAEFGDAPMLTYCRIRFEELAEKKVLSFDKIEQLMLERDEVAEFAGKATATRLEEFDVERWAKDTGNDVSDCVKPRGGYSTKRTIKKFNLDPVELLPYATKIVIGRFSELDNMGLLRHLEATCSPPKADLAKKIQYEREYLGYIDTTLPDLDPRYAVVTALDTKYSPKFTAYCLKSGKTCEMRVHKRKDRKKGVLTSWADIQLHDGDIIYMKKCKKEPRVKNINGEWKRVPGEFIWWIHEFFIVEDLTI